MVRVGHVIRVVRSVSALEYVILRLGEREHAEQLSDPDDGLPGDPARELAERGRCE